MLNGWVHNLSHLMIDELQSSGIDPPVDFCAIFGFVDNGTISCQHFDGNILPSPIIGYDSAGSGSVQSLPFLNHNFDLYGFNHQNKPDVGRSVYLTYWTIKHAIDASPGFVGPPISISTITRQGNSIVAREYTEEEIEFDFEYQILGLKERTNEAYKSWYEELERERRKRLPDKQD